MDTVSFYYVTLDIFTRRPEGRPGGGHRLRERPEETATAAGARRANAETKGRTMSPRRDRGGRSSHSWDG